MAPRILFLPDAGPAVGGGHVVRSLTLAKALEAKGAVCTFLASPPAQRLLFSFGETGGGSFTTTDAEDLDGLVGAAVQAAASIQADAVVVDHYRLSDQAEGRLRPARVAVIDDLADRRHDCDLLVDPSLGRPPEAYDGLVPDKARRLVGAAFALVRPEFARLRETTLARRARQEPIRRALVALGLTDPDMIARKVVRGLLDDFGRMEVDVTVGREAQSLTYLEGLAAADFRIRLHIETTEMARLMAEADIGIGAGGSSIWERACLGLPSITIVLADNQRLMAQAMEARGATLALDTRALAFEAMLSAEWYGLAANAETRKRMTERSAGLCDGQGAERVADAVLELVGQDVALGG
jgi:UDP-2,4-diacetamido-2,4,6-trideoxy-beta-L-altropyranose hydrolase